MVAVYNSVNYDRPGECSPEKDCFVMTLTDVSAQVVETSDNVITNSPSQDYTHPEDHNFPTYDMNPGSNHLQPGSRLIRTTKLTKM